MRRLRRKIEQNPKQPRILVSELGVGYRLATCDRSRGLPVAAGNRCYRKVTSNFIKLMIFVTGTADTVGCPDSARESSRPGVDLSLCHHAGA